MISGRENHILVWMGDGAPAGRLCEALERSGLAPTWAASLPEAIAAVDRDFPRAVACTLEQGAPSLIDLETLLANLAIGHSAVSLPPIPIWAVTPEPARHAPRIEELGLPVRLVPVESGVEGLAAEVVHHLRLQGWHREAPSGGAPIALYLCPDPRVGYYLSRYLGSRGISTLWVEARREAFAALGTGEFRVLVVDLPSDQGGVAFLRRVGQERPGLPVVALGDSQAWLARLSPRDLPPDLVCMLPKPVKVETLEACLKRLLRIPAVQRGHPAVLAPVHRTG